MIDDLKAVFDLFTSFFDFLPTGVVVLIVACIGFLIALAVKRVIL